MDEAKLREALQERALKRGFKREDAEVLAEQTMTRFLRLIRQKLPGVQKWLTQQELDELLNEAFEHVLRELTTKR